MPDTIIIRPNTRSAVLTRNAAGVVTIQPVRRSVSLVVPKQGYGPRGYSAYELAVQNGYSGTEQEWLDSLVGPQGPQGEQGPAGEDGVMGVDGLSAYEIAVANGFAGTEADWLLSLVGPQGEQGPQGATGSTGATGATGATGPNEVSTSTATNITGILKGNGSTVSAAVAGTDYSAPGHTHDDRYYTESETETLLSGKVDTVTGKGLSTEDYTTAEKTKLAGIAEGATANQTDSYLLSRANHTGTQTASTISDFQATVSANTDVTANTTARHSHSNKSILDSITEAFTTALKSAYDTASSWITTNGATVLSHLSSTSNPHSVTAAQVGLGNVLNVDTTNPANITQSASYRFVTDTEKAYWTSNVKARLHDFVSPYSYVATAPSGSAQSSAVWTIKRIQINSDGTTTTLTATGVAWTNRYSVTYS